ncbi:MAG TPA: NUDIX hydrolase, partial [Edaphobacter sp.]
MASRIKKPGSAALKSVTKKRSSKKTQVLSSKRVYKGRVFSVYSDDVIEPTGAGNTREVIRHSGSVVILAVDESKNPDDPEIIFERQYRHAAGQFLLEVPAGR